MAGKNLLYVDHHRAYRSIMENRGRDLGLSPYLAHSPQQALEKLAGRNGGFFPSPDILICRYHPVGPIGSVDFVRQVAASYQHSARVALLITPNLNLQAEALGVVKTMRDGALVSGVLCKEGLSISGIDDLLTRLRDGLPLPGFVER